MRVGDHVWNTCIGVFAVNRSVALWLGTVHRIVGPDPEDCNVASAVTYNTKMTSRWSLNVFTVDL
jgi:hypothetical protein